MDYPLKSLNPAAAGLYHVQTYTVKMEKQHANGCAILPRQPAGKATRQQVKKLKQIQFQLSALGFWLVAVF
jgi:hypothetical protein